MKYGAFYHMWFPDAKEECIFPLLPRLRGMGFEGVEITLTPDLLFHCHFRASHRGILGDDHIDWVGIFRALKRRNSPSPTRLLCGGFAF